MAEGSKLAQHPLGALFRMSADAVCGIRGSTVVFCNGAAREMFGRDVTSESTEVLFPGLDLRGEADIAAAVTVAGKPVTVSGVSYQGLRVLTIRREERRPPVPEAAVRQLRLAAANLRLSMDAAVDTDADEPGAAALFHSYYSLLHRIQQLADLNALDSGELVCPMAPVELGSLCAELMDSAAYFLSDRGVRLRWELPETACVVNGDRERLEQLILILLSNGLHAAGDGGQVLLSLRPSGKQVFLTVSDTGEGMDEAELRAAFAVRHDRTGLDAPDRAGLGLAIAEGIARLHGGTLLLRSEAGRGTWASLRLPLSSRLPVADGGAVSRGPGRLLTELSDLLSSAAYGAKHRD